jgi:hypothetical protein
MIIKVRFQTASTIGAIPAERAEAELKEMGWCGVDHGNFDTYWITTKSEPQTATG